MKNLMSKIKSATSKAESTSQDALKCTTDFVEKISKKSLSAYESGVNGVPSSSGLSKVSFWSGLGSLIFGFPANAVGVAAGIAVEDRQRMVGKDAFKKSAEAKTKLSNEDLMKSRIGLAAGVFSLAVGFLALLAMATKHKN